MCIKLEIIQGYTTMHSQPVIKIIRYVYPSMTVNSGMRNRYIIRTIFLIGKFHAETLQQTNFQLTQDERAFL